jgi:hypothetical protein
MISTSEYYVILLVYSIDNLLVLFVTLRGVVEDLSGLRDRGPGFKTRS